MLACVEAILVQVDFRWGIFIFIHNIGVFIGLVWTYILACYQYVLGWESYFFKTLKNIIFAAGFAPVSTRFPAFWRHWVNFSDWEANLGIWVYAIMKVMGLLNLDTVLFMNNSDLTKQLRFLFGDSDQIKLNLFSCFDLQFLIVKVGFLSLRVIYMTILAYLFLRAVFLHCHLYYFGDVDLHPVDCNFQQRLLLHSQRLYLFHHW